MRIKKVVFTLLIIILAFSVMAPGINAPGYYTVKRGQTVSIARGRAGVHFSMSNYNGTVKVTRRSTDKVPGDVEPKFTENLIDVRLTDSSGKTVTHVLGAVYVYFQVRPKDLRLWDQGQLSIYYFDTWKKEWRTCYTYAVRNGKNITSLGCRMRVFGLYGLARK